MRMILLLILLCMLDVGVKLIVYGFFSLLTRNVDQRLGAAKSTMFKTRGVQEVKSHPFFKEIDWNILEKLEMPAPFCPKSGEDGEADVSNFDEKITKMVPRFSDELAPKYRSHLQRADEDAFSGNALSF